ncbi:uncharacterized protein TM35_002381000 [Trypanosoma theileri]|uniref:Uncharacterized protein n=1 Tax=Trypanosoma theileri TaxID=67003 RepID=A0A1X0ND92_9TRYP|nr:uncharacterized protein TM35_002381000 [Trypanosoma theileri]ORC78456.1 hypothetical protein TM35_002381000 [Trypanosoma theileri]
MYWFNYNLCNWVVLYWVVGLVRWVCYFGDVGGMCIVMVMIAVGLWMGCILVVGMVEKIMEKWSKFSENFGVLGAFNFLAGNSCMFPVVKFWGFWRFLGDGGSIGVGVTYEFGGIWVGMWFVVIV